MEQTLDIGKYIDGVRRRLWLVALIFIPGALIATGIAYILPPVYESTARILVESQKIPTSLAQSTVTVGAAERLQLIEQRVLARENVLDVIERLRLFEGLDNLTPTDKVDMVRQSTDIQLIEFSGANRRRGNQPLQVSAFTITYTSKSASIAAQVANELVTRVLELNLQSRSEQAQETHDFFRRDVERLAADLIALETEIANYKKQNEGSLPTTLQMRQGTLQNLVTQLFTIDQQRKQFTEELRTLQDRLRTLRTLPAPPQSQTPEERQLAALKAQLAQEETFLTDQHPLVRSLRGQIAAMEQVVRAAGGGTGAGNAQQAMQIDAVQSQIALLESQIRLLDEQQEKHTAQKAELENSIADTPRVEAALNAFQRRYDDLQTRYQVALRKQAEAATGEKLELDQKAERFEVIEQARVPTAPVAPKRMIIAASGAIGSLFFGLGIAFLLELLSSAIRTAADLERSMQLRPIVTVPYIHTRMEVRKRRLLQGLVVLVFVVVLPGSIWMVNQYVTPIEAISEWVLDKTGMEQFWQDVKPRLM